MESAKYLFVIILFLFPVQLEAQSANIPADNELWTGFTLKKKLNKQLRINLDQQVRFNNNFSDIKNAFVEGGLRYKPSRYFYFTPQIRYTFNNFERNSIRFSFDATGKYDFNKSIFELYSRGRLQLTRVTYTGELKTYLRGQFGGEVEVAKWCKVFAEYEGFFKLTDEAEFHQHRGGVGTDFRLNKNTDLKLFFQLDRSVNVKKPSEQRIVSATFSFDL